MYPGCPLMTTGSYSHLRRVLFPLRHLVLPQLAEAAEDADGDLQQAGNSEGEDKRMASTRKVSVSRERRKRTRQQKHICSKRSRGKGGSVSLARSREYTPASETT